MVNLPLANILHHKLRSFLSALGVAIGVCLLITLSGLARGSLEEVASRWDAVDADLIVYPAHFGDNITTASGGGLAPAHVTALNNVMVDGAPAFQRLVPVFISSCKIGNNRGNVVGVSPNEIKALLAGRSVLPGGRIFDPRNAFADWISAKLAGPGEAVDLSEEDLASHGGLEMIVDTRLAKMEKLSVGSTVYTAGHHFTVVGIVPDGALARVFVPIATAEYLFGEGRLGRFTLLFGKLQPDLPPGKAVAAIRAAAAAANEGKSPLRNITAVPVGEYRAMLESTIGRTMYLYVDVVNTVTLIVAFLFVLVTLYTMVLQRTREIAILKAMGASKRFILAQVLGESMVLTAAGTLLGIALSFPAGWGIEAAKPDLTVTIGWTRIALAAGAAMIGGVLAALYPAFCAMRVDVVEALSLE